MADELIPYSDPATGFTPLGSDPGTINESVVPKSRPLDPSPDHVEALRLNPEFSSDFDTKFGAGSAARYLAQAPGAAVEAEKPARFKPALSWSTADILAANKPENPIAPMADAFVDSQVRKLQATRDGAALSSVEAFMRGPGPKTKADWLDDEIRSAEWSVGYWQQEMAKTDIGRLSYNADYERAHARLEAARNAKRDLEDKSERTAEPQVQIAIASRIADQKGRVAYAEDQFEAAKDGDLGTGLNVKQYEENLRYERKKLNALEAAMDYARQKKAVDGASATGEIGRSFLRSMLAETPEMLAGAVEQISKNFGSEYGQMASEIAGEVKSIAKGLKQDMPAPKQSEILALDPKSPEFANNLKLYAAHALGQGVGSTTAFWLAAAVGGPATAGGMGITLGIGQMRNALEEEFAKEGLRLQDHDVDAIVYSYGTAIGMLDAYGAMFNLNMLGREVKTAAVRGMASAIARGAAKGAIVEGTTEGLQEAIQMLGENYALDRNMDWTKFRDRVIENFAAGSIPGMAFGAKNAHTEQGSARARAEYEKILKEIEAQSTLKPGEQPAETQAPTVSSQPETVSGVETEQRGGRPLPPVQAEVRDPATIPKPEPVSPQPETLSELSTQEKTDLVEVAKESGIAREGEAPEETLQRMREQRAEGASFGKYDAVFDRLDAVEQELEQQRAKDATVQPDDVEAIVDMWRFVNEAARVKDPEGLIDFLRRSGGIVDFNGDVTSTLGEARMRTGLISNSGLPLDAAARLAWDHGFLTSVERPDINALLDAINEDHAGNRVVRGSDRSTLDDLKIARDMAEELRQFGIKKGMSENEVRDALKGITREGGSGTQDVAANPRGPQPRTIDQVFKGEALASYLERGGQTDVSAWPQIAEALGIELKDVGPALDAAVADGTLRKHDGRYWRNQDVFADDIPFALAGQSKAAAAQAELDKHERVQALVRLAIGSGQAVNVPKEITERIVSAMRDVAHVIPEGVHAGAISRIEPIKTGDGMYPDDDVMVTYLTVTGDSIETTMPLSFILSNRALFDHSVGGIFSTRLFVGQQASNAIAGEVHHESLHARWRHLDGSLRDRLFAHSDTLGVLDMQMGTYLTIVGDPTAAYVQSTTLREAYEERYAGRANLEDVMRQEAVAHLVELASHGYFSEAELAPIAGDLAVLRGEAVEMSPAEESAVRQSMRDQSARGATLPDGTKINGVALFAIRAYHGSPHDFDKFDISKIGSGEGAQAFGFGLYFAESSDVANSYRSALSARNVPSPADKARADILSRNAEKLGELAVSNSALVKDFGTLDVKTRSDMLTVMSGLLKDREIAGAVVRLVPVDVMDMLRGKELSAKALLDDPTVLVNLLPRNADDAVASGVKAVNELSTYVAFAAAERSLPGTNGRALLEKAIAARVANQSDLGHLGKIPEPFDPGNGRLYEVNIKADPEHFLDWDKPLSQQSEKVRELFNNRLKGGGIETRSIGKHNDGTELVDVYQKGGGSFGVFPRDRVQSVLERPADYYPHATGRDLKESLGLTEDVLREAGIPGIKYLDQGSRGAGEGSRNYVVFDDALIEIVAKDGVPIRKEGDILAALSGSNDRLDMSPEARKARAEQMGFDTSTVWYHGTPHKFDRFDPSADRVGTGGGDAFQPMSEHGVFLTRDREIAEMYGKNVLELYVKRDARPVDVLLDEKKSLEDAIDRGAEFLKMSKELGRRTAMIKDKRGVEPELVVFNPEDIRSVNATFDPAEAGSARLLAALSGSDAAVGRSMRADLDRLGYYSKALEAAKSLKQSKGTPEQMLAQLKAAGVKDAEIEAANLKQFLDGKTSITRDDLVKHLTENRVGVKEVKYGEMRMSPEELDQYAYGAGYKNAEQMARSRGMTPDSLAREAMENWGVPNPAKWANYSLDPSNPTYRETVLHLPIRDDAPQFEPAKVRIERKSTSATQGTWQVFYDGEPMGGPFPDNGTPATQWKTPDAEVMAWAENTFRSGNKWNNIKSKQVDFQSGHFPEPNIIGHMMTSMNHHEGKPVFTLDQIQSDWGQKLRDGGVRDEAKIAELKARIAGRSIAALDARVERWHHDNPKVRLPRTYAESAELAGFGAEYRELQMLEAELATAEAATPGHPLVNTTDQWTNTTLRRALRQAVEADAEYIAIPHGDTVLSYNPGDEGGMRGFYGSRTSEGIVPKNLRKLLEKIDKDSAKPVKVEKLTTSNGFEEGWQGESKGIGAGPDHPWAEPNAAKGFDTSQTGFTLFPLTDKVKRSVMEEGQALFALSGYRQGRNVTEPENLRFWQKPPRSGDVLMFHGTRKTFEKFDMSYSRDFGVHFGTAEQAGERLVTTDMEGARTIPVEITLKNAIVMRDPGFWGPEEIGAELQRRGYNVTDADRLRFAVLSERIDSADARRDPNATLRAVREANQAIAEKLNALGIDGIWYRNRHEGSGWSLTVWNKGQVRSATSNDVLMAMRPSIANRTMPDGQRRVATAGTAEPARSLSQLVADLNQALGLTTRVGRLSPGLKAQASAAGGKLRGQYNTATDVTRLAIPLDIETLSHEGGHALEERFGLPLRVLMEANAKELEKLATPGKDQLSEGFAEFIRRYVTNPNMAEARAPKFFKAFEQFVDKVEPSLLKRLHEVTTGYQDWINAPSGGAVLSTIKSAKKDGLVAELTKHARKNGFRNVAVDYFHSAYTALIDGLHPVKMATDKLIEIANQNLATPLSSRGQVGVIAARDPYKLLRLARNAYQGGHVDLMRGVRDYHTHEHKGPSLHDAIGVAMGGFENAQWSDDNLKAFGAYLISRRMVAEWNRFKAGELEGMPDKLSQADHIQAQKDFEQQFPQFIDAAELVYQYQRNLLRKAMEAGFVSEDTYEDLIKRTDYVPAHRDMSEDAEETVSGAGAKASGSSNKARLLKQFRGSTRDIINPLETIAKTTYEWNFLIARNDAIKALDRLARAVGPGGGKIAERIPSSQMSGTQVNAIEIVKRAGKQAGMDEADLLFLTTTLEEQLGDDADTVIFRPGEITEGGEPIVYLWEGGKRVAIRLADGAFGKEMYEAITGLGRESMNVIAEFFAKPSQWLRAGVTLDPAFVAANWMRDNPAAWIVSGDHGMFLPRADRSLKASIDALRSAFGAKVDDLDVLASTGGMVGGAGMEGINAARVDRDIKALQKNGIRIRDALPHKKQFWELTGVTETGTRLSVFRAARERALRDGLDDYEATVEAAYTANDLIDFGRFGSKMLVARRMFTFLNAFIQGIDKAARTATGGSETGRAVQDVISPYVRQADGQALTVLERRAVPIAAQMFAKMTVIGFIGFALSALYRDDPDYEEIPEYFRNTHWVFKDPTGTWRRVPKPFELGAMSLAMERSFEAYYKGDTKAMKRLVTGLADLVTPPHVVPGVQVAYELWANKSSFTGGPIVPPNLEKLPGELQFTAYTSELSKWMAVGTGVSAAKIDHAIAGITGSLGRSLLDKSNVIMPPVGMFLQERGMPTLGLPTTPRPEQRDVDRIFVRRFTVDPARSSESKKEFWKEMSTTNGEMAIKAAGYKEFYDRAQFDEAAQTLKRMKEHERVYALVEGHGSATDKREHPMNRAKSVLEVTNGIRRDLDTGKMKDDNGNAYSPSDRRVIQEMFEQIQMREARNAQIVLGLPGFTHLKIMPVEPVIRELEAKVPSIAEELDYRLRKARVKDFDEVRDGYADLKARVLEPDYVEANPPRRKVGRRSP